MPRRRKTVDPELRAHQEWLGYLQPVGLVVAPAAIQGAGWVLTRSGSELIERQQRYRDALKRLNSSEDGDEEDVLGFSKLSDLLINHLGWDDDQIQSDPHQLERYRRELPELGETLTPTAVIPAGTGNEAQMLVRELPPLTPLDKKTSEGEHLWRATPQERFERLLRETEIEAGLLFNGRQLRLVVAPKGESSGYLTFPLQELAEVSGRLMFSGLDLLLGQNRVFFDPDGTRLADVLKESRKFQAVVSTTLADQVLAALWELLRGFEEADQKTQREGKVLLGSMPDDDPQRLYGGLITVLMRLVFLLYAEDEGLMPSDTIYEQNYKVSGIFEQLRGEAVEFPETLEQRYGAWSGLMSLCRLVFDGGGARKDYLPARHGQLFDPDVNPWLETPWLSDGVVLNVLENLLVVDGERISYRALDVEQIGSVYEGIMGYGVRRMPGWCIGLRSKPQGTRKQITTVIDLEQLLAIEGRKRKKWVEDEAQTSISGKAVEALKKASRESEVLEALESRIDGELFKGGAQAGGSLVFQPTAERRRSGSHYTPRSLTRPIVEEALRPWLERYKHRPTAAEILDLKICDPAMGSGAFLVESCRYVAELLERSWSQGREGGLPPELQRGGQAYGEEPLIYARRLIAQRCLYGVDKNPFAVNLAKLSLWLVTLSKDAPFTFVDHALKCGDSLVGIDRSEIEVSLKGVVRQGELQLTSLSDVSQQETKSFTLFHGDSRNDADDEQKRQALKNLETSTAYLRTVGDLLVASFFNGKKPKDRRELKQTYLQTATMDANSAKDLEMQLAKPLKQLRSEEKGTTPLHWQLTFPDVFNRDQPGFDVFVGNPPFAGKNTIAESYRSGILDWFKQLHPESDGNADLAAHFFRRCFHLLRPGGTLGLIATNTIAQGDTRSTGLRWICLNGGTIYSARKRYKWPGAAAVVVSVVHLQKGSYAGVKLLDQRQVEKITAFLFTSGGHEDPKQLAANRGKSFQGSIVLGMGFTFDDSGPADDETPDIPSPISTMERLIAENPKNQEVIFPYLGGSEVNNSPIHAHHRYVINFGERSEEECRREWPELMAIVERKVKPSRISLPPKNSWNKQVASQWWLFGSYRKELSVAIAKCERVLVIARVSTYYCISLINTKSIFADSVVVFSISKYSYFSLMQSNIHETFVRFFASSLKDDIRYTPSDCFLTFPLPSILLTNISEDNPSSISLLQALDAAGEHYQRFRDGLMVSNDEGLTSTYNRFHDPKEVDPQVMELRRLHSEMDQAVLNAYDWTDILVSCGFGLDHLDIDEESQLPGELQEGIDSGELFFQNAEEAVAFQAELKAYGVVNFRKKLSWRYRWSDAVQEDVLARLLDLNAERYAEEAKLGLYNGWQKSGKATSKPEKRRGRPPKNFAIS